MPSAGIKTRCCDKVQMCMANTSISWKDRNRKDIDDEADMESLQAVSKVVAALLQKKLTGVECVPTSQACSH